MALNTGEAEIAQWSRMEEPKRFVYVLRSVNQSSRYYVGLTSNVAQRVVMHNEGRGQYTRELRPWQLVTSIEFAEQTSAIAFEKYLKTGSGRAFAKRHFV
jgi:putative endonuclease